MPTLLAKDNFSGQDFKRLPPGAHFAICNMIVDCGVQPGYKGKPQHKFYVRWEVPDERLEYTKNGQQIEGPMTIGRFYTLSLAETSNLRADLENWRGQVFTEAELKGFDVFKILGKACQLQVTHDESSGKTYANVTGIMGLNKAQREAAAKNKPKAENPLLGYSLKDPDQDTYDRLPEWLQKRIDDREGDDMESLGDDEPSAKAKVAGTSEDFDDDIPF